MCNLHRQREINVHENNRAHYIFMRIHSMKYPVACTVMIALSKVKWDVDRIHMQQCDAIIYTHMLSLNHYRDVIMGAVAYRITSLMIVYSTVYSGADQRKHQSSASLAFVRGILRWPVNFRHKWPVTREMFLLDDVIMESDGTWYVSSFCVIILRRLRE